MGLTHLDIKSVRNLQAVSFTPNSAFNLFCGQNGSGKTSILEAIYLLSRGKSFRSSLIRSVIQHEKPSLSVFSWVQEAEEDLKRPIGIEKNREGKTHIRIDHQNGSSVAELAALLPLQIIHPESDSLITGSPKNRRHFLDWGVFHVELTFFEAWQRLQRVLKQRNAAIKATQDKNQVSIWDQEYTEACETVSSLRRNYLNVFEDYFQQIMRYFLPDMNITLCYQRGWPAETALIELLSKNSYREMQTGYTLYGAHRDDMAIFCEGYPAAEALSRGEQKLLVIALYLAQGQFLKDKMQKKCLYLLDDFAAELDVPHRRQVTEMLYKLNAQVFMTSIDYQEVKTALDFADLSLFHVEQGNLFPQ